MMSNKEALMWLAFAVLVGMLTLALIAEGEERTVKKTIRYSEAAFADDYDRAVKEATRELIANGCGENDLVLVHMWWNRQESEEVHLEATCKVGVKKPAAKVEEAKG